MVYTLHIPANNTKESAEKLLINRIKDFNNIGKYFEESDIFELSQFCYTSFYFVLLKNKWRFVEEF